MVKLTPTIKLMWELVSRDAVLSPTVNASDFIYNYVIILGWKRRKCVKVSDTVFFFCLGN